MRGLGLKASLSWHWSWRTFVLAAGVFDRDLVLMVGPVHFKVGLSNGR